MARGTFAYPYPGRSTNRNCLLIRKKFRACVRPGVLEVRARPLTFNIEFIRLDLPTFDRPRKEISRTESTGQWASSNALLINSVLVIFMTGKHVLAANEHRNMEKSRTITSRFFWMTVVSHKASRANRLLPLQAIARSGSNDENEMISGWRLDQTLRLWSAAWARRAAILLMLTRVTSSRDSILGISMTTFSRC